MSKIPPPPPDGPDDPTSEASAHTNLEPHLATLAACIRSGWDRWEELGALAPHLRLPLGPRARACFVYEHIVAAARAAFTGRQGVRIGDRRGFLELLIGRYVLRFKKLDRKGLSRNVLTDQQREWFNVQLSLPGMPPEAVRLIAGYQLDVFQSKINAVLLTRPKLRAVEWKFSIEDTTSNVVRMPTREPRPADVRGTETQKKLEDQERDE